MSEASGGEAERDAGLEREIMARPKCLDGHPIQRDRILKLLRGYAPNFCPLPEILNLRIASHTRRIHELRKSGCIIEIKEERIGLERHTAYRLVSEPGR